MTRLMQLCDDIFGADRIRQARCYESMREHHDDIEKLVTKVFDWVASWNSCLDANPNASGKFSDETENDDDEDDDWWNPDEFRLRGNQAGRDNEDNGRDEEL